MNDLQLTITGLIGFIIVVVSAMIVYKNQNKNN